jgi:hypothetical protein
MSPAAARRLNRPDRHTCSLCRTRRARFKYRGEVRADRDHNLCFKCFRAETNRQRARLLASVVARPVRMTLPGYVPPAQPKSIVAATS